MNREHVRRMVRSAYRGLWLGLLVLFVSACKDEGSAGDLGSGYYLSGRVIDGETLLPIKGASLALTASTSGPRASSHDDGSFIIGPIPAQSSYRLVVNVDGYESFLFNGLPLPALADDETRAVAGDVVLYKAEKTSPGFKVVVGSRDPKMSTSLARGNITFTPVSAGTDPALAGTLGQGVTSADIIGAYREPGGATLTNHARVVSSGYLVALENGAAEIPEGALHWGATYAVEIDGGSSFAPASFLLTAVRGDEVKVWLNRADEGGTGGVLPAGAEQYFTGRIYNGVTLERIVDYAIRLEYFDRVITGTVDATGRYVVGPLLPQADYTIVVEAEGYRSFLSHNKRITGSNASEPSLTSLYYDAFLYPDDVPTPRVHCRFRLASSEELPSGMVRLAPRSASSLFDEDSELPAGVDRQIWVNDEDLQQRAVVREIKNGDAVFEPGELVYGVEYAVTVYGVDGYALAGPASFRAGVDVSPSWILEPLTHTPLRVVFVSSEADTVTPDASLSIRFNQPIAVSARVSDATMVRALNENFSIQSPDEDKDTLRNVLKDPDGTAAFRGVGFTVSGETLTLTWNRSAALAMTDADDPIESVTYGGLNAIWIYPTAAAVPVAVTLGSLLENSFVTVRVRPL